MGKDAVVIIFGCRHQKEYCERIETALKWVLDNGICPIFVFTGADPVPSNRIVPIFGNGRIIYDDNSRTTQENITNTLEAIKNRWIGDLERIWISSWYHIPKIKLFLRRAGIDVSRETFVKSYSEIAFINVLIEPLALLAAFSRINQWPMITCVKRGLGYNV